MLKDQRKTKEKFVQLKSIDEVKEAIKNKKNIYLQDGEDFSDEIMWDNPQKEDFFISEAGHKDCHNSGENVLCVNYNGEVLSSYSYVDKKGLFRRREGHEHLTMVLVKTYELEPLISKTKEGYLIAGNMFTEQEILNALKIETFKG